MSEFTIKIASGTRSVEQLLLRDIEQIVIESAGNLGHLLSPPILLVVPSNSLRNHLLAAVVRHQKKPLVNFRCVTHFELARELLEPEVFNTAADQHFLATYTRRAARRESSLSRPLGPLKDGFGAILGTVRDLLDAGFHPAHADALHELLSEEAPAVASRDEIARAHSIIRVAQITAEQLALLELRRPPDLLREATDLLALGHRNRLAETRILVYGYADATGLVTDFLIALLRHATGDIYLSHPKPSYEPCDNPNSTSDQGVTYRGHGRILLERLAAFGTVARDSARSDPAELNFLPASGPDAECRAIADRARCLIDNGTRPESIGILARDLPPYLSPLRRQFTRVGIPFSATGVNGRRVASENKIAALLDVLGARERTRVDRWLDALGDRRDGPQIFDLRLAFASLGASRLGEIRMLEQTQGELEGSINLPVRTGIATEPNSSRMSLPRRRIERSAFLGLLNLGSGLLNTVDQWSSQEATIEVHLRCFEQIVFDHLRWRKTEPRTQGVLQALSGLRGAHCSEVPVSYDEFVVILRDMLAEVGSSKFGGAGGGVQILDVMQARGRTFEHVFLMGLNRGSFPRPVHEDPFLPDTVRQVISRSGFGLLPDLQLKLAGLEEEIFLFNQILSSSSNITLSWQATDADSKPLAPSTLLERLRVPTCDISNLAAVQLEVAPHPLALTCQSDPRFRPALRPAFESAVLLGLEGDDRDIVSGFQVAVDEWDELQPHLWMNSGTILNLGPRSDLAAPDLARARIAILREIDPKLGSAAGAAAFQDLSPYHGLIGRSKLQLDPRLPEHPLFITTLEGLAHCPWQTFVTRLLRIEPLPDPAGELPHFDKALVGTLVHRVLERIVNGQRENAPRSLEDLTLDQPHILGWPSKEELERIVLSEGRKILRTHGIAVPGMANVLTKVIQPILDIAHDIAWGDEGSAPRVAGAEVIGRFSVLRKDQEKREVFFKVDRGDVQDNRLVLTDYKTGVMFSNLKTSTARRRHFLQEVAAGHLLQAAAYASANSPLAVDGRYLVLNPSLTEVHEREVLISSGDPEVTPRFEAGVEALLDAWDTGAFFPRLEEAKTGSEPRRCKYCSVSQACLRGDSGARIRLREWVRDRPEPKASSSSAAPWVESLLQTWFLGIQPEQTPAYADGSNAQSNRGDESSENI